jgi:hypothetical protein
MTAVKNMVSTSTMALTISSSRRNSTGGCCRRPMAPPSMPNR